MGDIYISRNEDGELTHSVKGRVKPNHRYITRRYVNGRWVYTYPKKKNGDRIANRIKNNNAEYQNELNSVSSLYPANRETSSRKSRRRRRRSMQLQHSAVGTTWTKNGAAYISRVKKNGKWVYTYASKKAGQARRAVSTGAANVANTVSTAAGNANRSVRSAVASSRVNPDVMSTRLRKKTRKNVARGKKKVSEILGRLRESAAAARTEANKKARAVRTQATIRKTQAERAKKQANIQKALNKGLQSKSKAYKQKRAAEARKEKIDNTVKAAKSAVKKAKNNAKTTARNTKKKIKNAVSVKETAYITDVSTGKRRPAPTDLFDNASNTKRKKKTLSDKIEQKVINYVAKEVNKNSTKSDVIKLASKMGYSSSDVAEIYDYIKDELNDYNSDNSSTGVSRNANAIRRKRIKEKYKRKS